MAASWWAVLEHARRTRRAFAEDCVTRAPPGDALRLNDAGQVGASDRDTGPTGREGRSLEEAGEARFAA
jgi:hypothetical protein